MFIELAKDYLGLKAGQRVDTDDATAGDLITKGVAKKLDGNPLESFVTDSAKAIVDQAGAQFQQQIDAILKKLAIEQGKSRKNAVPAIFGPTGEGDPKKTFGTFLLAVRNGDRKALDEMGSKIGEADGQKTAMSGQGGATGGFTVPQEFYPRLMQATMENSIVRPRATVIPMGSRTVQVPCLDITTAPTAGDTALAGGVVCRWTEEAVTLNETEPNFKQIELVAHELSGYSLASNSLLADNAVGLEALLYATFGAAIGWFEDFAFLRGDGAGKPLGALTANCAISTSRQTATSFTIQDAGKLLGKLLPGWSAETTCWIIHPTVVQQVMQMVSAAAGVGWLDNLRDKLPMRLLGLPVAVSEKLVALGTAKDVALCDFRHYLIGDRGEVEIAFSDQYKFINNQSTWRFVKRVDGQPWLRSSVTLSDASSTVSPFNYLT